MSMCDHSAGSMHAVGGGRGKGHSINVPWETQREKRPPGDSEYCKNAKNEQKKSSFRDI